MTLLGHELAGRYRLDALIGAGGMATVYRAHDTRLDRDVAVKLLSTHLAADPVLAERFQREARALAAFTHPAIVAVYDVGEEGGDPFFVMELVAGETLADRLARSGPLPPDEGVDILTSVAQGLGALHARGFIHRDVKPHNILLAAGIAPGAGARLADFGLVRGEAQRDLTAPGTAIGTMAYLAPEILAGDPATPAADVYALAAVAYEALTGRPPFPSETLPGLVTAQAEPVPAPSLRAPWLGSAFDAPLVAALGPAAERPDLGSFADALAAAAGAWAAAGRAQPRGNVPAITQNTIDPGAATAPVGTARPPSTRRPAPVWLFAAVAAVLGLALLIAFLGLIRPFEGTAGAASTSPPATDTPSLVPETEPPVVEPVSGLQAAFDEFAAALQAAQGGRDGLRGKDANELEKQAAEIRRALAEGDAEKAVERADELVRKVEELREEEISGEAGDRLLAAAEGLRDTVQEATGSTGGEDGEGGEGEG
jgi:serine/threonine-protein kinase